MMPLLTIAALCAVPADELALMRSDRAALPPEVYEQTRYISLCEVPENERLVAEAVLRFMLAYTSSAVLLDQQMPFRVPGTNLYRIDQRGLQWRDRDVQEVCRAGRNPYTTFTNPLVIRGDWLIWELSDGTKSDAYYRLLYGGNRIPKTRDEFLNFWSINPEQQLGLEFGLIEGESRVNKARHGSRWIEHHFGIGREHWGTRDVTEVREGHDPLNSPTGEFAHEAEEHFVLIPKSTLGVRGVLAATILADGEGRIVQSAPEEVLEDYSRFKGGPTIINPGSCISCHTKGSQRPTQNAVQQAIFSGLELYAKDPDTQGFVERFHLGGIDKELSRWDEDYAAVIAAINGLTPEQNATAFKTILALYGADLTIERAAIEVASTPEELTLAIAYASANKIDVGVRLSGLVHGQVIPRTSWESNDYLKAMELLKVWRLRQ